MFISLTLIINRVPIYKYILKYRNYQIKKTIEIKDKGSNKTTLDNIKSLSTQSYGRPYDEVLKETRERYLQTIENEMLIKDFEPLDFLIKRDLKFELF